MTGKIYISKGNPQDVLRNAVAERKERFDRYGLYFKSKITLIPRCMTFDLFHPPPDLTILHNKNGGQKSLDENRAHFSGQALTVYNALMSGQVVSSEWGLNKVPRIFDMRARLFTLKKAGLQISEETIEGAHGAKNWFMTEEQRTFNKKTLQD